MQITYEQVDSSTVKRVLTTNIDDMVEIAKALSSEIRVEIFKKLLEKPMNVAEISEMFNLPASTAAMHINKLEDAGLILTELVPGTRGTKKVCAAIYHRIIVETNVSSPSDQQSVLIPMPIGHFFDFQVSNPCGIISEHSIIGEFEDPRSFYDPARMTAQLIWFRHGFVEYRFPKQTPHGSQITNLEITMEICSEAPLHNPDWPSDITVWINGVEIGMWTSPGDFGGERGLLTPSWWETSNTQFGLLKTWRVTTQGSYVDGRQISGVVLQDLKVDDAPFITVRIGVKPDAENQGGINIFGRKFGNYEKDIEMRLDYVKRAENEEPEWLTAIHGKQMDPSQV